MEKVASWLEKCPDISRDDPIIDLGSGNGMMCIELVCWLVLKGKWIGSSVLFS